MFQMCGRVHAHQLLEGRQRSVVMNKIVVDPLGNQMIADRAQSFRTLRMIGTYVMQMTIAVGNECGTGQSFLPAVLRNGIKPPIGRDPVGGKNRL